MNNMQKSYSQNLYASNSIQARFKLLTNIVLNVIVMVLNCYIGATYISPKLCVIITLYFNTLICDHCSAQLLTKLDDNNSKHSEKSEKCVVICFLIMKAMFCGMIVNTVTFAEAYFTTYILLQFSGLVFSYILLYGIYRIYGEIEYNAANFTDLLGPIFTVLITLEIILYKPLKHILWIFLVTLSISMICHCASFQRVLLRNNRFNFTTVWLNFLTHGVISIHVLLWIYDFGGTVLLNE